MLLKIPGKEKAGKPGGM